MINMKKTVLATSLLLSMGAAHAAPVAWTGVFNMYDSTGGYVGGASNVTGFIDQAAGTFAVASTTPFFGQNWTASGGMLFGPGTYTHSTVDPSPAVSGGNYTFTVGAGQIGAVVDFAWGGTTGIDVLMVWNVATSGGNVTYTSVDTNADVEMLIPGTQMIDGPFAGFSANFNMQHPVPIPAAVWLLGSGLLGLVGVARRRKALAA